MGPLFSYTTKPSQGKREKRKQKASREQQEWEHGKYENYWVSIVFRVFHMIRKCSGLSFYVSCFMFPVFCLHVSVGMFPASSYFCQCYFPCRCLSTILKPQRLFAISQTIPAHILLRMLGILSQQPKSAEP